MESLKKNRNIKIFWLKKKYFDPQTLRFRTSLNQTVLTSRLVACRSISGRCNRRCSNFNRNASREWPYAHKAKIQNYCFDTAFFLAFFPLRWGSTIHVRHVLAVIKKVMSQNYRGSTMKKHFE